MLEQSTTAKQVLDYAGPLPPVRWLRTRKVIGWIRSQGPFVPRPGVWTLLLTLGCIASAWWVAQRPEPWRLIRSYASGQTNGASPNVQYLPDLDAIAFYGSTGRLRIVRPWTDEVLMELEPAPTSLPPNPAPGRSGDIWWLEASDDRSHLLGLAEIGAFVWDVRTGRVVIGWPAYSPAVWQSIAPQMKQAAQPPNDLGPEALNRPSMSLGALSPDGSRVAVINDQYELLLYDISAGSKGKLLARHQLHPTLNGNEYDKYLNFTIRFSPDGRHVLALGQGMLWLGDSTTLEERFTLPANWGWNDNDVAFLRGGEQMLVLYRHDGQKREIRLYDIASGAILRHWDVLDDPWMLTVSPDEKSALVAFSPRGKSWAGLIVDLTDDRVPPLHAPLSELYSMKPAYFPDNRRVMVSNLWHYCPGIIDTSTGRHIANLYPPTTPAPGAWNVRQIIPSRDGRFVALVQAWRQIVVCEKVGEESAWGVVALPRFYLLAVCIALLIASLCRDALRTRRRAGRTTPLPRGRKLLAAALAIAGGCALASVLLWAMWISDRLHWQSYPYLDESWLTCLMLLHLVAAPGLLMGSRVWNVFLVLLLIYDAVWSCVLGITAPHLTLHAHCILDRMWMLPTLSIMIANFAWAGLSLAAIGMMIATRRRSHAVGAG